MVKKSMKSKSMKKGGCWSGGCTGGKRKTAKKGGAYGVGAPITAGALEYGAVDTASPVNSATGVMTPDIYDVKVGGRRRKTSKKSRKSKKSIRKTRKMRGGAGQVSMGGTYAEFSGKGVAGMADYGQGVKPGNAF